MIDPHTIQTLEFPKIIGLIVGRCLTPYGREQVGRITPLDDNDDIARRLDEIAEMKDISRFGDPFPLERIEDDSRELVQRSRSEGAMLEPKEILQIQHLVRLSIELHEYDPDRRDRFPAIDGYLRQIRAYPELRKEIGRCIDEDGLIRDNASRELRAIRQELADSRRTIIARLEAILARRDKQAGWQDDVITQRNDRYVIPIPAGRFDGEIGILHDRSQSGATLYIEPKETVALNNRLRLLMQKERLEMDRILRALTAEIAAQAGPLLENTRLIGALDLIHACAQWALRLDANRPQLVTEALLDLQQARHPLLIEQCGGPQKVVPSSLALSDDRPVVLVTGPNTGGKTVILKTVGLLVLMARSGLHIPADAKSRIGRFRQVYADIGDEQSLETSLSTFSSHMKNVVHALDDAESDTLLLFDEIGAGTDPKEGAALAEAIILHTVQRRARLVASTHYSQLKTLPMEYPEVENASLEFDRESLQPTFRLHIGIPGSSYAVEIARRLGLSAPICDRAARLIGSEERSLEALAAQLERDLSQIKEDRHELTERLAKAKQLEMHFQAETERLQKEGDSETAALLEDTERFMTETRQQLEHLVAEIRKSQAPKEVVQSFHQEFRRRDDELKRRRQRHRPPKPPDQSRFSPGDTVHILSLDREGEIEQLVGQDRARVRVGSVTTTVEIRNLRKVEAAATKKTPRAMSTSGIDSEISSEIHLLGMTGEEAVEALERYLDKAVIAGLHQVYVVHGKGTGALRRILTQYLKGHRDVEAVRLGNWNEGGAGVTVVKLKS